MTGSQIKHSLQEASKSMAASLLALLVVVQVASCVITVQIGGATRLNSLSRQRDRYNCYWDCDLVGCQIARDDDECAYDCEKICRVRYDYAAAGRSGGQSNELRPKSGLGGASVEAQPAAAEATVGAEEAELLGAGTSVRLHLPRNASARNFAIWERCASDSATGKLTEKPFSL